MAQGIQIGQVARETGLTVDAIRFYEKQRLLKPAPRTEGGFRLFSGQDLQHIQFIRRAQGLGFSLSEIRELLVLKGEQVEACTHVRDMLTAKLDSVRQKIIELRKLESQFAADLKRCEVACIPAAKITTPASLESHSRTCTRRKKPMKVEVFYFEGCPNHKPTVERVKSVMKEQGIAAKVAQVEVPDADAARAVGFLGSPTIRVNGLDIDPASRSVTGAGIACRCYAGGLPPEDMIRAALLEAQGEGR
jgi:DNA-binding transcriptional MerR regulator